VHENFVFLQETNFCYWMYLELNFDTSGRIGNKLQRKAESHPVDGTSQDREGCFSLSGVSQKHILRRSHGRNVGENKLTPSFRHWGKRRGWACEACRRVSCLRVFRVDRSTWPS
jgi:hypothetical protein